MDVDTKQPNKAIIAIVVIFLLAAATTAVIMLSGKKETTNTTSSSQTESNDTTASTSSTATGFYKDGNYSASGAYQTPGGNENVTVKVTLADGVITAVDMERDPTTAEAEEYQGRFVASYKSEVEGKKIDEVSLNRVAGSSLTPGGFNKALDTIKNDARS